MESWTKKKGSMESWSRSGAPSLSLPFVLQTCISLDSKISVLSTMRTECEWKKKCVKCKNEEARDEGERMRQKRRGKRGRRVSTATMEEAHTERAIQWKNCWRKKSETQKTNGGGEMFILNQRRDERIVE